ncbi:hypothetical protein [Sphingomonas alpina]|uniref:Protein activator of alkane oxidation PraB n=1 Tax=Sphingomonas alpina TaxID=653931 RepID=A0A7H0LJN6_9SPHN|nr:hypothetical protein [Sphingomonas alpina]QNQ09889.1 hypothetical protein H3Z74_01120 [Sphingomonas alpina]
MKLFSAICASALALAGAGTANATTYTPAGTYVFQGSVNVNKGIALTCVLKLTVVVPEAAPDAHGTFSHGHTATATPVLSAGNFLCPTVTFSATPYPVSFDGTNVTLSGVVVNTITPGGCSGSISGVWNGGATPRSISLNASLPGGGTSAPCTIVGTITQISGPAGLTITNP